MKPHLNLLQCIIIKVYQINYKDASASSKPRNQRVHNENLCQMKLQIRDSSKVQNAIGVSLWIDRPQITIKQTDIKHYNI